MVYQEKSKSAPLSLEVERAKKEGTCRTGEVIERLSIDFKNKCYICEEKASSFNIEHFIPHKGDKELKFDWANLFLACSHCNNTKLGNYDNILNCTKAEDKVETRLKYELKTFPDKTEVTIESLANDEKTKETKKLIMAVYNGTTPLKKIDTINLRDKLVTEMSDFHKLLKKHKDAGDDADREYYETKIEHHLNRASAFTAFKRWIVRDTPYLMEEFAQYLT